MADWLIEQPHGGPKNRRSFTKTTHVIVAWEVDDNFDLSCNLKYMERFFFLHFGIPFVYLLKEIVLVRLSVYEQGFHDFYKW